MSAITPKKPTPEIYAPGDQVAVYTTDYGKRQIYGIFEVGSITAHEAILKAAFVWRIPLGKKPHDSRTYGYQFKPAEQIDFDALSLHKERIEVYSKIKKIREIELDGLSIEQMKSLNAALEITIKATKQ